jgi:hypothetical protein
VLTGYYSASEHDILLESSYSGPNSTQDTQLECEVGYYCKDGIKVSLWFSHRLLFTGC